MTMAFQFNEILIEQWHLTKNYIWNVTYIARSIYTYFSSRRIGSDLKASGKQIYAAPHWKGAILNRASFKDELQNSLQNMNESRKNI